MRKETIDTLYEILRRIAQHQEGINAYAISLIPERLDRVTVMRIIDRFHLVEHHLVRVEKGKRNSDNYFITFWGILFLLHRELGQKDAREFDYRWFDSFVRKNEEWLPLVFGKWAFFRKAGIEEIAFRRLRASVANMVCNEGSRIGFVDEPLAPVADIKTTVTWFFYFLGLIPVGHESRGWEFTHSVDAWLIALKQDKEIQQYFIEELGFYRSRLEFLGTIIERVARIFEEENGNTHGASESL